MFKIPTESFLKKRALVNQLETDFSLWRPHFQEIARYLLPRRYIWLTTSWGALDAAVSSSQGVVTGSNKNTAGLQQNNYILDATGTVAARTLAHGLMNGITSPARPWFRLRIAGLGEDEGNYPQEWQVWLEEVVRRMHIVFAESNFYNALGVLYLELVGFGTAAMLIYDDFEEIIRCYNSPVGEFRLIQDSRKMVVGMARTMNLTVAQMVEEFGLDNVSPETKVAYKQGGAQLLQTVNVTHLIEKNNQDDPAAIAPAFEFREMYWENGRQTDGKLLRLAGYREKPMVAPRWEITGNDTYGHSPTMDALPDIKQLQLETKIKAQAMDKMVRPPIVADVALQSSPTSLLPGGIAFVPSSSAIGAKPIFTVNPPLGEMTNDLIKLQIRIKEIYYNNLFRNVSDLDTVRSAAEIYERKGEDMVLLGAVLERFENEALDPAITRTFNIMKRRGLLPPEPPGLEIASLQVQYVSILFDAQRAATVGSMERFMQIIGQLAAAVPDVLDIPDYDSLVREYSSRLNVPAKVINSREAVIAKRQQREQLLAAQQEALVGEQLTSAAKNLSQADVGGGQNALQAVLGG